MKILIGTANPGKLREYRELLADIPATFVSTADAGLASLEVDESADTFTGNALIKARAYAQASGLLTLADDSGLAVDALDGAPGVHSARYGGNGLDDNCNGQVDEGCGCPFGLCQTPGQPMINGCDPCVTQVCGADPYCCATAWDSICVNQVASVCGQATCVAPACAHLVCVTGSALSSGCHSCVASICAADPFCCNTSWDNLCVGAVGSVCGLTC